MGLKSNSLKNVINKFKENEILSKGSTAFIFKIIGSLLGYVFLILVTRTSGAEVWGVFALCLALLNITSIFSRMGIDIAILKFISSFKDDIVKAKAIYLKGLKLVFSLSIFFTILLYFLSEFIAATIFNKNQLTFYIQLIAFAIIPFTIIYLNAQSFRGLKKISHFAFFQHVSKFLLAIIFFVGISFFTEIPIQKNIFYAFIAALYCVMILSIILLKQEDVSEKGFSPISSKELLKTAFPMMLSTSILLIMSWADSIIIGIFKTEAEIGIYNVSIKLAMISGIVLGAVNSIVAPKLSQTYNNGKKEEFKSIVKQSTRVIFFSSVPILIFLIAFPEFLLSFFGSEFIVGKTALYILLIGQIINAFSGSVGVIMQMTGKEKLFQNILILALFLNIGLNFLLIPNHGIEGAAIASSASIIFWNLTSVAYIYNQHQVLTFFYFK